MPNDRSIPDAAVWKLWWSPWLCAYCVGQTEPSAWFTELADAKDYAWYRNEKAITTVQRAMTGCGEGEAKGENREQN